MLRAMPVPSKKSNTGVIVAIVIILLLLAGSGVAVWYFIFRKKAVGDTCSSSSQCVEGLLCKDSKCVKSTVGAECQSTADCNDITKECDPATHNCVDKPECSATDPCAESQDCVSGVCIDKIECDEINPCASGYVCNSLGVCVNIEGCSTNEDCDESMICDQGSCIIAPECSDSVDCEQSEKCWRSTCVDKDHVECNVEEGCPTGNTCYYDVDKLYRCVADDSIMYHSAHCDNYEDCPGEFNDYRCIEGYCVVNDTITCVPGTTKCPLGHECIPMPISSGYYCNPFQECGNSSNCPSDQFCVANNPHNSEDGATCQPPLPASYCDFSVDCEDEDMTCYNGSCIDAGSCSSNYMCHDGFLCVDSKCRYTG